jgi:polar amino acid transport system substrate-binding protein
MFKCLIKPFIAATIAVTCHAASAETLAVGSSPNGVPITFLNTKTNKIDGIMADVIHAVGTEAGFTPEIHPIEWKSLIPALNSSKIDLISSSLLVTPERAKVILFTDPVFIYGEALVVSPDDKKTYTHMTDLKNLRVGIQVGAVWGNNLKAAGVTDVRAYDTPADIMKDLSFGRIDAGILDGPIAVNLLQQNPQYKARIEKAYQPEVKCIEAIGVRLGDQKLAERINAALKSLRAKGQLQPILAKWGIAP